MANPVIFDTDAGSDIDDLYALALIVAHPELELLGVTTVAGDTRARARLVAKMLRLQGAPEVPVSAGLGVPSTLAGKPEAADYRQNLTHCHLVEEGDPEHGAEYADGVEFILEKLSGADRPHDASGRTGQDRIRCPHPVSTCQPTAGCHDAEPLAPYAQALPCSVEVALQHGGQVGVCHRGVATADQLHQWTDAVRNGDVLEPDLSRQLGQLLLVLRISIAMEQDDGH